MLFSDKVKAIRENKTLDQISDAQSRIKEVTSKIASAAKANVATSSSNAKDWDWTNSYAKYQNYEDLEELQQTKEVEEQKLAALSAKFDNLGHYHSHDKEREMFEKPEEEKMKICEQYRIIGNYLFHEGLYAKAALQFQITIAYYEYCFPSTAEEQLQLDNLRHRCLCNISKCYSNMGNYRQALQAAETVIKESKTRDSVWLKAMYRRAVAYRYLDEYDLALNDLKMALTYAPGDTKIIEEIDRVKRLNEAYVRGNTAFAKLGIQTEEGVKQENEVHSPEVRELLSQLAHMPLEPIPTPIVEEWNRTFLALKNHKL